MWLMLRRLCSFMWLASALLPAVVTPTDQGVSAQTVVSGAECRRIEGGVVRGPSNERQLALVFTAHEFGEGAQVILDGLARRGIRAGFFLTGAFLRSDAHTSTVRRIVHDGHYVGPHSDAHLLYAPWTGRKVTLVSREEFTRDLTGNLEALKRFGVQPGGAGVFLPPYEWYTAEIAEWSRALGLTLICHTAGTRSNADYTGEGTPQFVPSDAILKSILQREREDPRGLNGFILPLHLGAGPGRKDKFHLKFDALLDALAERGYRFVRVDRLIQGC